MRGAPAKKPPLRGGAGGTGRLAGPLHPWASFVPVAVPFALAGSPVGPQRVLLGVGGGGVGSSGLHSSPV